MPSRRRRETPSSPAIAGDLLVRRDVPVPRRLDYLIGQLRAGRRSVPVLRQQPVPQRLLVIARLCASRLPAIGRPEAGRVGREYLVGEHDDAVCGAAELDLRVGEQDPTWLADL